MVANRKMPALRMYLPCLALLSGSLVACQSSAETAARSTAQAASTSPPPPQAAFQRGRALIDAKTLTLRELVDQADRIVVGSVERIDNTTAEIAEDGRSAIANIRDVTIRIERALKGDVQAGQRIRVRQLLSLSAPLKEGETVMWFLAADSSLGLTQPLGLYSGDFRVDTKDPAKPAVNLRQNAGLWEDSLWTGDGFERTAVLGEATTSMKLPRAARSRIDAAAGRDPGPAGVPLDLLISATMSQVKR